jgi:hypothetical protein
VWRSTLACARAQSPAARARATATTALLDAADAKSTGAPQFGHAAR